MTDKQVQHIIGIMATLVAILCYVAGYISGGQGWWWTVIVLLFMYLIVFRLIQP